MKRKNYLISYDDITVVKHAWNSSIRTIESLVRDIAKEEVTTYSLINSESIKTERKEFIKGFREWKGDNGRIIKFKVTLEN